MSARYEQLQKSSPCLYTPGSPVVIVAFGLLKDTETGSVIAQVKFQSIDTRRIVAARVDVHTYDISGDPLEGLTDFQYLDLNVSRDDLFGAKTAIHLPDYRTRQFSLQVNRIVFSDNTEWASPASAVWEPIVMQSLTAVLGSRELVEQYRRETIAAAEFVPEILADLWICSCGTLNRNTETACFSCLLAKERAFTAFDKHRLDENLAAHKATLREEAERQRVEREAAEERRKRQINRIKKKAIRISKILLPIIACIGVVLILFAVICAPKKSAETVLYERFAKVTDGHNIASIQSSPTSTEPSVFEPFVTLSPIPAPMSTPQAMDTPISASTLAPTQTLTPTTSQAPTSAPTSKPAVTPTQASTPTPTPRPTPTPTTNTTPTPTPTPKPTPIPTPDLTQGQRGFPKSGLTNSDYTNIRSTPSIDGNTLDWLNAGTELTIYRQEGDWYYVLVTNYPYQLYGYILVSEVTLKNG